jgi:parvulin-like peptidyl-prolyl isomerase
MKLVFKLLIFFFAFSILSCSQNQSKIIVGKFDSGTVNLKESIDEYNTLSFDEKQKYSTNDDFSRLTRKVALEKIIYNKALKDGLDNDKAFLDGMEETKKNIGFAVLKKKNVSDKVNITESDYIKYTKNYEVYQIVKRTDNPDKGKIVTAKKELEKIAKTITNLETFKEAAKKYSEDITSSNGGLLGKIRPGIMEEEIDKVMENLGTGKVSKVIETNVGLHIIFIDKIEEIPVKELIADKDLFNMIYKQKSEKFENQWYDSLLSDSSLKINKKELKSKKADNTVIVEYKGKKITRKEILDTVEKFRQGNAFPEPTEKDMETLAKNMGLNLILETMIASPYLLNSKEYKERLEKEKQFLLVKEYIEKNIIVENPTDEEMKNYYQENLKTMFSFKDEKTGKIQIQKYEDAKDFIAKGLYGRKVQTARYDLYKKMVEDAHYKTIDNGLVAFVKEIKSNKK